MYLSKDATPEDAAEAMKALEEWSKSESFKARKKERETQCAKEPVEPRPEPDYSGVTFAPGVTPEMLKAFIF